MTETPGPTRRTMASIALITLGLLILVPAGLCTGYFGLAAHRRHTHRPRGHPALAGSQIGSPLRQAMT